MVTTKSGAKKPSKQKYYAYFKNNELMTFKVVADIYVKANGQPLKIWDFHHDKECLSPIPVGLSVKEMNKEHIDLIPKQFISNSDSE